MVTISFREFQNCPTTSWLIVQRRRGFAGDSVRDPFVHSSEIQSKHRKHNIDSAYSINIYRKITRSAVEVNVLHK